MKRYPAHVLHTGARFQHAAQVSGGVRGSQAASDRELEYLAHTLLCSTTDIESTTRLNLSHHFQNIRGVISFIILLPRNGNTSRSKRDQTRSACAGTNADFRFSCQRSAMTRKASLLLGSISDLFFIGSRPSARIALATVRLSRAAAIPTLGYAPNESSFSLPPYRYFIRQSLAPLGCTSRNNPPASASLYACSRGFEFLAWLSVRGMGVSLLADTPEEYPQNTPTPNPAASGSKRRQADANHA